MLLGWQDVKQAYRRSKVGPFWITLGMAVQIATMGAVFSIIFKIQLEEYLPFLSVSIVLWTFLSSSLADGTLAFINAEPLIRQLSISKFSYVFRVVWRNLLILGHNLVIIPILFLVFQKWPGITLLAFLPGLVIVVANLTWLVWLLATVSVRFRDAPPMVTSLITIGFYVTPVMWSADLLNDNQMAHTLLGFNPIYHFLQIVRLPLLGDWPTVENWSISVATSLLGWAFVLVMNKKTNSRIAYWL